MHQYFLKDIATCQAIYRCTFYRTAEVLTKRTQRCTFQVALKLLLFCSQQLAFQTEVGPLSKRLRSWTFGTIRLLCRRRQWYDPSFHICMCIHCGIHCVSVSTATLAPLCFLKSSEKAVELGHYLSCWMAYFPWTGCAATVRPFSGVTPTDTQTFTEHFDFISIPLILKLDPFYF